ncbi:GDP-mannose transporter [Metarhizium acridum CQMa 102]|uniref:GDP-mannose transporter n=1 Tax=Metarhizium acridum (strain CQMa 102) TaxID=655827 RepID=E9DW86_METAQ|nr:GDP-mannose transporter [Metarhizium acridum CQMa 102]EFY91936.1 GDP-mannose transporter [Metarhizium acridum CQMa 102]
MGDKKNEDFIVQISDGGFAGNEKEAFTTKAIPSRTRGQNEISQSLSKLDNSPPLSVVAYCFSSISMTVVNKYVVSGTFWNLNFFYLAVQAVVCIAAISACKSFGLIRNLAPFDQNKARKWFPISLLLVGMIYTSTKALQFLSVPVYTIFKNLTIIVIAYGEVLWFGGSVTPLALLSFGLMVLSSVVAAWADIQSAIAGDFGHADSSVAMSTLNAGYAWMGLNVFCTASYVLGMRKVIKKMNFKDWDILFICSLLAEDWSGTNFAKNFPDESRNRIIIGMVYSGLAAIFISYCSAWCIRVTSSTTYSMVGALNKLPIAISGLVFFAAPVTFGSVSAIVIGFVSGIVYAWARVRQSNGSKDSLPTSRPPMSASSQSSRDAANS